jgi:hypothetical protein
MDSKKRHELEQNELAKWIAAQYNDWLRPNSGWLGYAVLGVLVVVAVFIGTARVNTWNRNSAWKQYYSALHSPDTETALERLADSTSGIVGTYARLALAQRRLSEGCSQVFIDKKEAITALDKAVVAFQQAQRSTSDPSILQQAGLGLGLCWETLSAARVGDDRIKAEEAYQKVIDQWEDSLAAQRARKQLAWIRQPSTVAFLALTAAKTAEMSDTDDFMGNFRGSFGLGDPFAPPGEIDFSAFGQEPAAEEPNNASGEEPKQDTE